MKSKKKIYVVVDQDGEPFSHCSSRAQATRELEAWRESAHHTLDKFHIEVYNFSVKVPD